MFYNVIEKGLYDMNASLDKLKGYPGMNNFMKQLSKVINNYAPIFRNTIIRQQMYMMSEYPSIQNLRILFDKTLATWLHNDNFTYNFSAQSKNINDHIRWHYCGCNRNIHHEKFLFVISPGYYYIYVTVLDELTDEDIEYVIKTVDILPINNASEIEDFKKWIYEHRNLKIVPKDELYINNKPELKISEPTVCESIVSNEDIKQAMKEFLINAISSY
jgi:hypothetical protein